MDQESAPSGLATLLHGLSDAALSASPDGRILWLNERAQALLGAAFAGPSRPTLALLEDLMQIADPEGRPLPVERRPFSRALAGLPVVDERCILTVTGEHGFGLSQSATVTALPSQSPVGVLWFVVRVLAPANADNRLHREVERRGLLLREMSHRVRNQLQLLAATVATQGRALAEGETKAALDRAAKRIHAVAAVHGQLHDEDPDRVDLARLLQRLADELGIALLHDGDGAIETALETVACDSEQAAALALIANELLTNAIKHGRPTAGRRLVRLTLRRRGRDAELAVADNGPGCGPQSTNGRLGTRLIAALAQQIGAHLERTDLHPGCKVALSFEPKPELAAGEAA